MTARMMTRLSAATAMLIAGATLALASPRDNPGPPNFVLIISDDQDYEHFGFMGHPIAHTPELDRLARAGAVFLTGHVPVAQCHPTLASFLSGRWPQQTGIYSNYIGPPPSQGLARLDPTNSLPSLLRAAGYATFVGGKFWEGYPEKMGFTHTGAPPSSFVRSTQERAFRFLDEEASKKPFFLWWAPQIPHTPHDPPERYLKLFDRARIDIPDWIQGDKQEFRKREHLLLAMEAWLDAGVAQLLGKLRENRLVENTMIIFVIDNGWANGLYSKGSPFEKGVRTPLIFTWPGHIKAGQRFDHLISGLDVYPTILDYASLPIPQTAAGRSLRPIMEGKPGKQREVLYGASYPMFAT